MSLKTLAPAAFTLLLSATLFAQGPSPGGPGGPAGFGGPFGPMGMGRGSMGLSLAGRATVTGAPFSGTETITHQETLAGGNQINHQTQATISRDSQGRVATQHTGPAGGATITIVDPVAGYSYFLNPSSMTAMRMTIHTRSNSAQTTTGTPAGPKPGKGNRPAPQREDLGTQVVNGVSATGTRTTVTIPAGAVGNQQPLQSVREVWMATDLKIPVSIKSTDPRGNTDAELTNIVQGEPDPTLFQVPAGYTMTDAPGRRGRQ